MSEQRCEVTELIFGQCGHCRKLPDPPPVLGHPTARPFVAAYRGECSECGDSFQPGDRIQRDGDGGYVGPCCLNETGDS